MGLYARRAQSSSGGGLYSRRAAAGGAPKFGGGHKKRGRHGVGGFFTNLGGDIEGSVAGLGPTIAHGTVAAAHDLYKHPELSILPLVPSEIAVNAALHRGKPERYTNLETVDKFVKPLVKSYIHTYGPLFHGDVNKFVHRLYEHPLGPIMDALAVMTLGTGGTVRAASLLGKDLSAPRSIALRSPAAIAGQKGPELERVITGSEASRRLKIATSRMRMRAGDKLAERVPHLRGHVGEVARYGRQMQRIEGKNALRQQAKMRDYNRAVRGLSKEEFAAMHIIGRGVHPADLLRFYDRMGTATPELRKVLENPKIAELVERPPPKLEHAIEQARKLAKTNEELLVGKGWLTPEDAAAREGLHREIVGSMSGLTKEMSHKPFYLPDVMVPEKGGLPGFPRGGGTGVQRNPVHHNEGVLLTTGRLAHHPDLLGPKYLSNVKVAHYDDLHSALSSGAVRVSSGWIKEHGIPQGWTFLRDKHFGRGDTEMRHPRPQRISATMKNISEHEQGLHELSAEETVGRLEDVRFDTPAAAEAARLHGDYLLIPKGLAKQAAGEFTRSSAAVRMFLEKPTQVWRAIILGYRLGFLTNNVVGNNLLFAIKRAGPAGAQAYLNAVRATHGADMVRRLLKMKRPEGLIDDEFLAKHHPEQLQTFGKTQYESLPPKLRAVARHGAGGIIPGTQAVAETFLRRAGVEEALRRMPEVRAIYRAMPRQARSIKAAAEAAYEKNPQLIERVSAEVNDTLGDYLGLSNFERGVVRQLIPFWAWYRTIVILTGKLALDNPVRIALIARLGQMNEDIDPSEVPDWLRGSIALGKPKGDLQKVMTTQAINPYYSGVQVGKSARDLAIGKPGAAASTFGGEMNPFIAAMVEQLTGRQLFSGNDVRPQYFPGTHTAIPGPIASALANVVGNLPMLQLNRGPSKLYPKRDFLSQLEASAGFPIKTYSRSEARRRKAEQAKRR